LQIYWQIKYQRQLEASKLSVAAGKPAVHTSVAAYLQKAALIAISIMAQHPASLCGRRLHPIQPAFCQRQDTGLLVSSAVLLGYHNMATLPEQCTSA